MYWGEDGTRMTYLTLVGCLLALVALVTAEEDILDPVVESNIKVVAVLEDYVEYEIMCHHCYKNVHGDDCVTMNNLTKIERKVCAEDEVCMVEWLKTEGELTTFTRGCGKMCKPGCRVSGDSYQLERCRTCCEEDLCNSKSGSAHHLMMSTTLVLTSAMYTLFSLLT